MPSARTVIAAGLAESNGNLPPGFFTHRLTAVHLCLEMAISSGADALAFIFVLK